MGKRTDGRKRAVTGAITSKWDEDLGMYILSVKNPSETGPRRLKAYDKDYDKAIAKLDTKVNLAKKGLPTHLRTEADTVAGWLEHWLPAIAKRRTKPKTFVNYTSSVRLHIVPNIGPKKLRALTIDDVNNMTDSIVAKTGIPTAIYAKIVLGKALKDAVAADKIDKNVAALADNLKPGKGTRKAMSADQSLKLIRTAHEEQYPFAPVLALMLFTGIRLGEALGLTWDYVQLSTEANGRGGWVDIEWQLQSFTKTHGCGPEVDLKWPCGKVRASACPEGFFDFRPDFTYKPINGSLCLAEPKTERSNRKIPMTPQLNAFMSLQARKTKDLVGNDHNFVFLDPRPVQGCQPIPPRHGWTMFKQSLKMAGLPEELVAHETRHTTVSLLTEAGIPVDVIALIVGHSSASTTSKIYTHIGQTMAGDALSVLDDLWSIMPKEIAS